ncbi:hypothetical protein [Bacillus alkalicellulosilyticus]|uniref:hypothetical protein n=1 Tax=Alkalihalobacterium alkalicellulosilyticum TaxID=1912214 RepID=UPI00099644FC|nr:hypothetical protein [Bacillus alkalicellulosilyticus]
MEIIKNLTYNNKSPHFFQTYFSLSKQQTVEALAGVEATIDWLQTSIYENVVRDVTFYLCDEPINFPGELEITSNVNEFQPIIYINILTVAEDYSKKEYHLEMKQTDVTCFEYAAFVCLHEFGHLIHGLIGGAGKGKRERLLEYFGKGEPYYNRFLEEMNAGYSFAEKKKYRQIPHEKAADQFALQQLKIMMSEHKDTS